MTNSYYDSPNNDEGQEPIVDDTISYDQDDQDVVDQVSTTSAESVTVYNEVQPQTPADQATGVGFYDAYRCNEAEDTDFYDISDEEILDIYNQTFEAGNPENKINSKTVYYRYQNQYDDVKLEFTGDYKTNKGSQYEKLPCLNFPYNSGWDYVDYVPRSESHKGPLGEGAVRLLSIPGGPPKGYGNISHNPISYNQTRDVFSIMHHMDGRKWNHIMSGGTDPEVQDGIGHTDDWESGIAYTASNAAVVNKFPGIHTTAGGANAQISKMSNDVRYGKWKSKDNNSGKNLTPNAILLGHQNTKGSESTQDFGVVGISGFINAHVSDVSSPKKGHSNEFCTWQLEHVYGMYRFDTNEDELEERTDNAQKLIEELKEIISIIQGGVDEDNAYCLEQGRSPQLSTDNFITRLYRDGVFERLNNFKINKFRDGIPSIVSAFFEFLSDALPINKNKSEDEKEFPITGEFLLELLEQKNEITMAEMVSYIWTSMYGVPDSVLRMMNRTIDLEGIAKFTEDEVLDHILLDRFVIWAFINRGAVDIYPVSYDDGEYVVTMANGVHITYAEFVNYSVWGWESVCESNNGYIITDPGTDVNGNQFYVEKMCVNGEIYDETGEEVEILDRMDLGNKVYIGMPDSELDDDDFIESENSYRPPTTTFSESTTRAGTVQWPSEEEIKKMTRYKSVNAVRGRYKGNPVQWDSWPKRDLDAITLEFKTSEPIGSGEVYKMYEWINNPNTNEDGTYNRTKPAFEFWSAPTKYATGRGVNGWEKVGGIGDLQPNGRPKQGRPQGTKTTTPERRFLRVVALCPNKIGTGNECNKFIGSLGWGEDRYLPFQLSIVPARKNNTGDVIDNESEGPCYHAREAAGNNQPIVDWTNGHWDQPMRSQQVRTNAGLRKLKVGKFYELKVQYETGVLSDTYGVYPEFHMYYGVDRESLYPTADGNNPANLYYSANIVIPQATATFNPPPVTFKAETEYVFFACTKTGRTIDEWSPTGESWLLIKEVSGTELSGPSYYSERQNSDFRDSNIINIEEPKWQEPLTYYSGATKIREGGMYTVKWNNKSTGDYRIIFAKNRSALSPKNNRMSNTKMFSSNNYFDTEIDLNKVNSSRSYTFSAPSPYMILCAYNNNKTEDGRDRSVDNWSSMGETAGIDNTGINLTYKSGSDSIYGPAFWALNTMEHGIGGIDLNRNNTFPAYKLPNGYIDFNNNYWKKPINAKSIVKTTISDGGAFNGGAPLIPGKRYRIELIESISSQNDFDGRTGASYRVNWLTDDRNSQNVSVVLGDPTKDNQSAWGKYYDVNDGDDEIVKPNAAGINNSIVVTAKGTGFVLGLESLPLSSGGVLMREWPVNGHPVQVIVTEEVSIEYYSGYPAYANMIGKHDPTNPRPNNKAGQIPFGWEPYNEHFVKPWNDYRQNGIRTKRGDVYEVKWNFKPGDEQTDYDITFWWLNHEALMDRQELNYDYSYSPSMDDQLRYITLRNGNENGVKVVAQEDYLVFGIVDYNNDSEDKPYYDYSPYGTKVNVTLIPTGETEDLDRVERVGASYYAEGESGNLPKVWDPKFEEPLTVIDSFGGETSTTPITKGRKYRISTSSDARHDSRIFFIQDGEKYLSPKLNGIDDSTIYGAGGFVNTLVDIPAGGPPVEIYASSNRLLIGATNNLVDYETGEERTFENWSSLGEPIDGTNFEQGRDIDLEITDITEDELDFESGYLFHADYGSNGVTNINEGYPGTPSVILENGEVNFFNPYWIDIKMLTGFTDYDTGEKMEFVEGVKYDFMFSENPNYSNNYDPDMVINWMSGKDAETPNLEIGGGYQNRVSNYKINQELTEEERTFRSVFSTNHDETQWKTIECKGRGYVVGAHNFRNILNNDRTNYSKWSPRGIGLLTKVRLSPDQGDEKGPAYFADGKHYSLRRNVPDFTNQYWELPYNHHEQSGLVYQVNKNYRIKYDTNFEDTGEAQDTEYSFIWFNRQALDTHDQVGGQVSREISRDTRNNIIVLTKDDLVDGVVVKCLNPYLVMGSDPNYRVDDDRVNEWSKFGEPVGLKIELTSDPITEMEEIIGPAYFADEVGDITHTPDITNPHWSNPLTVLDKTSKDVSIKKGDLLRIGSNDATSSFKILFLGTPEALSPRLNGIESNKLFDGENPHFIDLGVILDKDNPDDIKTFYAPSDKFILSAFDSEDLTLEDGTSVPRELSNWSSYGEPARIDGGDYGSPDDGIIVDIVTDQQPIGSAYFADENAIVYDSANSGPDTILNKGQINFFDAHWNPSFNIVSKTTLVNDGEEPEDIVEGKKYSVTINHAVGYEYGGSVTMNWLSDRGVNYPSNNTTNPARDYSNFYAATDTHLIGETFEVIAQSNQFCVGMSNLTDVPGKVGKSVNCWSPTGYPISVDIQEIKTIEGPSYLSDLDGNVDFQNPHWNTPFNHYRVVGAPIEKNTVYQVRSPRDDDNNRVFTGLDYSFYFVTKQGLRGNQFGDEHFHIAVDNSGNIVKLIDKDVNGGGVAEIKSPDDEKYEYLILGAYDTENPGQLVTDWSKDGQPVNFILRITERDDDDDDDKGPGYYGSRGSDIRVTDFSDPHWERIYDWNNSPQNVNAEDQDSVVYFQKDGSYRISRVIDTKYEYGIQGARNSDALEVGDDHDPSFFDYGILDEYTGVVDLKNIDYEKIVFCTVNTDVQYTLEGWNPKGEEVKIKLDDVTHMVTDHGPAYWAGYNVSEPDDSVINGQFLSPLNTFQSKSSEDRLIEGERYAITFGSSLKGIARVVFAKTVDDLNSNNSDSEYIFDSFNTDVNGRIYPIYAESEYMFFEQWNVPGKTQLRDWSIDGEKIDVSITQITSPGEDQFGNTLKGPAYFADDNQNHRPDFTNNWWKKPLNALNGRNAFVKNNEYTLVGGADLKYKYKVWYCDAESLSAGQNSTFRHNNETFGAGETIKITALDTNVILGAYDTDKDSYRFWGYDGEPVNVTVTEGESKVKQGPGYYGSENENFTMPDFSDPHWERVFHYNNSPQASSTPTVLERGKDYRFQVAKVLGSVITKHDYDLYGARNDGALEVGSKFNGDLEFIESFRIDDGYVDVRNLPYDRVVFAAVNLGADAKVIDWNPQGKEVVMEINNVPIESVPDPQNPGNDIDVRGPAYYTTEGHMPDFGNSNWMTPLNSLSNVREGKLYDVKGNADLKGKLQIYFVKNTQALDNRTYNPLNFTDSGISVSAGETVQVRATSGLMIFGHCNKPNKTFDNWGRDGEEAEVRISLADDTVVFGPAYYAQDNPENEPEWLDSYWDVPLNSCEPRLIQKGQSYQITLGSQTDGDIKYKMWFSDTNRPKPGTRFVTNEISLAKAAFKVKFDALEDYLYFGAYGTDRTDKTEWSRKGEPVYATIEKIEEDVEEGPGYYGSVNDEVVPPDFSNLHWEEFNHYNNFPQGVFFEKDSYFRIAKKQATEHNYGVFGAKRKDAESLGPSHVSDFHEYGVLNDKYDYVDIREMQYTTVIFSALNMGTDKLTDWSPRGELVKLDVENLDSNIMKDDDGNFIRGPVYYQPNASSKPNFKSDWWVGPLNYHRGFVAGKRYKVTLKSNNPVQIYFADSDEALDPRTPGSFTDSGKSLTKMNDHVIVDATSKYCVLGGFNWPNKNDIRSWSRDGDVVTLLVEEEVFDESEFGPVYWANDSTKKPKILDDWFTKPLNEVPTRLFSKNTYFKIKWAPTAQKIHDISFYFSDDRNCLDPKASTEFILSDKTLKRTDDEIELKILGSHLFLGAHNLPGGHPAANDYKMWNPDGVPHELIFEEIEYADGPQYWADEFTTATGWKHGLPDFRSDYWLDPISVVEGLSKNTDYEIKLPPGTKAQYHYYIWETDLRTIDKKAKSSDFKLVVEVPKNSSSSVGATFTKRNVIIGIRNTQTLITEWSPLGAPTELTFSKTIGSGKRGISYFADKKIPGSGTGARAEYAPEWDNPKWNVSGNFRTTGDGAGGLHGNAIYKISLKEKNPKYVYTIWSVMRGVGDKPGGSNLTSRANHGNITLNRSKGAPKFQKIKARYGQIMLAAWDFNKDDRNLVNWSANGERVDLKIRKTDEDAVDIPWGPIMSIVADVLGKIALLLGLIFGLIGVNKPENYLVNFDTPVGLDEVPCVGKASPEQINNGGPLWSTGEYYMASNALPMFINKVAEVGTRFTIRWMYLRFNGYMINARNPATPKTGTGEEHWFLNIGFHNIAATHSVGFVNMGSSGSVRILPFGHRHNYKEEYHTRRNNNTKGDGKTLAYVPPRKLVTGSDPVQQQIHWDEKDRWFNISAAYGVRSPSTGYWDLVSYKNLNGADPNRGSKETNKFTRTVGFAKTHNSSQKTSSNDISVIAVNKDGSNWMNDNKYVDNIFNEKGWSGYFRYDHGKTDTSDHRSFHYVIGVESPEYKDDTQIIYQEWPVRPDDNEDVSSPFYIGLNFDLKDPKLGDFGSSDWQIASLRLAFGNSLAESVSHKTNEDGTKYHKLYNYYYDGKGHNSIYQYYNIFDMYPTSDTKYLFRNSTGKGNTEEDKYHQVTPDNKLNMTVTSNRIFYPNQALGVWNQELYKYMKTDGIQYLKSIILSISKGNANTKTYDYSFNISNLKPLAFRNRPSYIKTIEDYDKYHNPPEPPTP